MSVLLQRGGHIGRRLINVQRTEGRIRCFLCDSEGGFEEDATKITDVQRTYVRILDKICLCLIQKIVPTDFVSAWKLYPCIGAMQFA